MTVDYDFYRDVYGGKLSEEDFGRVLMRVEVFADNITYGRLSKAKDEDLKVPVGFCLSEMVEKLYNYESDLNGDGIKTSETVGPWSVTYSAASLPRSLMGYLQRIAESYLSGTYLLCRWV